MAPISAREGRLKVGANTVIKLLNLKIDVKNKLIEATALDDTYETFLTGALSWTATAEYHYEQADTAQDAILSGLLAGTSVSLEFLAGVGTGKDKWAGTALIESSSIDLASDNKPMGVSINLTGNGALTQSTQA